MNSREAQLDALDRDIRALGIEFEKYFNGALDVPPLKRQHELAATVRELHTRMRTSLERFRLSSLEARFTSYSEMWGRRVRLIEIGETPGGRSADGDEHPVDVAKGVVLGGAVPRSVSDALFQRLYGGAEGERIPDPQRFEHYLNRQIHQLRARTGCRQVRFRVAEESGRPKLKALPLRPREGDGDPTSAPEEKRARHASSSAGADPRC